MSVITQTKLTNSDNLYLLFFNDLYRSYLILFKSQFVQVKLFSIETFKLSKNVYLKNERTFIFTALHTLWNILLLSKSSFEIVNNLSFCIYYKNFPDTFYCEVKKTVYVSWKTVFLKYD